MNKYSYILIFLSILANLIWVPQYTSLVFWFPHIFLGACISFYGRNIILEIKIRKQVKMLALLLGIVLSVFVFWINDEKSAIYYLWRFISVIIFWTCIDFVNFEKKKTRMCFTPFFMFCTHFIVIEFVRGILLKIIGVRDWSVLLVFVCTFLGTVIIVSIMEKIATKILPHSLLKILMGGRM